MNVLSESKQSSGKRFIFKFLNSSKAQLVINALLFQALWFSIMSYQQILMIVFLGALIGQFLDQKYRLNANNSMRILLLMLGAGIGMDLCFIYLGLFEFPVKLNNLVMTEFKVFAMPLWLFCVWLGFVLTLQHSLQWIRASKSLCILGFSVFGTISYLAGRRFEIIDFDNSMVLYLLISWALVGWLASSKLVDKSLYKRREFNAS